MANVDLFGNEIIEDVLLRDKFLEPPFSILNSMGGGVAKQKRQMEENRNKIRTGKKRTSTKY